MKINIFGPSSPPLHGVSLTLAMFCDYCQKNGVEVNVTRTNINREVFSTRIRMSHLWSMFLIIFSVLKISVFKRSEFKYLICATVGLPVYRDFLISILFRILGCRLSVHIQGSEFGDFVGLKKKLLIFSYSKTDKIYVSEKLAKEHYFLNAHGYRSDVVLNGVPDHQLINLEDRLINFNSDNLKIIFLSNLYESKGILEFFDTLNSLVKLNVKFSAKICGAWSIEFTKETLEKLIIKLGLHQYVEIIGPVNQAEKKILLARSDILIFPSHRESFGNVVVEAMSAGVYVVASKTTSMPFILDNNNSGLMLDPFSPLDAAKSISLLDKNLIKITIISARNRYLEKFTFDKYSSSLLRYLIVKK